MDGAFLPAWALPLFWWCISLGGIFAIIAHFRGLRKKVSREGTSSVRMDSISRFVWLYWIAFAGSLITAIHLAFELTDGDFFAAVFIMILYAVLTVLGMKDFLWAYRLFNPRVNRPNG